MLKEERILRQSTMVCAKPCNHCRNISKEINALVDAVEDRCAEIIRKCKGIPFGRIDTGGRKWIYAQSDLVAAAIQTKRKK